LVFDVVDGDGYKVRHENPSILLRKDATIL
jgi:hypothetical protein